MADPSSLRPSDAAGLGFTALATALVLGGVGLTRLASGGPLALAGGALGQLLLGLGLVQWFVLLHECGHGTLFKTRALNRAVGQLAGFFSAIPFASWRPVHNLHHKWTGWQDLDPTTASLVPRPLGAGERWLMNLCWRWWIPAFAILYRVSNFWNLPRLSRLLPRRAAFVGASVNAALLAVAYAALLVFTGPWELARSVGPGVLLSLIVLEPIMISQHSHIPSGLSGGRPVRPVPAGQQAPFTRSLRFPRAFSWLILLHFDAHEAHHVFPAVPGHRLRELDFEPVNEAHWWRWIRAARAMPADRLLFSNRDETGAAV